MSFRNILLACVVLFLSGCAGAPMVKSTQAPTPPGPDQAQVIFMRSSSFYGGGVDATVYDATNEKSQFIGTLSRGTNIAYTTKPGRHVFMIVSEAADFLEADLAPGKVYFAQGIVRMGAWSARFSLWPAYSNTHTRRTLSDEELTEWLTKNAWMEMTPASAQWLEQNLASVEEKRASYWDVWKKKTPEDLSQRTLHPNDGAEPGKFPVLGNLPQK